MKENKKIIWLASYPKSGNTWMRAFLTNLLRKDEPENDINELVGGPVASARSLIEDYLCVETSDFTVKELEDMRPAAYRNFAEEIGSVPWFVKVHDAYIDTSAGEPLIPDEVTLGAIYMVRNPLDVLVSFAHHSNKEPGKMISSLANPQFGFFFGEKGIRLQVKQTLLSWSAHYESWASRPAFPVLVIRYEDMINHPAETFGKIVDFCRLDYSPEDIRQALDKCTFDKMREQEQKKGFKEKNPDSSHFFRKGITGSWREELTAEQAGRLIRDHKPVMKKLGYLDASGNPVY